MLPMLAARSRLPLIAGLILALPVGAHAQIGGLINKAKQKAGIGGSQQPTSAQTTADNGCGLTCTEQHLAITPDMLDRFIKGLKAELAERDRLEQVHQNDKVGQLYAARDNISRCDSLKRADSIYQANLSARIANVSDMNARTAALQELAQLPARQQDAMHQRCQSNAGPPVDGSFAQMLGSVQARQDTVGAQAAGMTLLEFGAAAERVAGYVLASSQDRANLKGYPPSAIDAMNARIGELTPLLKREFNISGMHLQAGQLT